jgi:DNA-directed RNA polymerase omega subunit
MYELVHLATKRARQLYKGAEPLVKSKNRIVVTALREIAAGRVSVTQGRVDDPNDNMPPMSN